MASVKNQSVECEICKATLSSKDIYRRHLNTKHSQSKYEFKCGEPSCELVFSRSDAARVHSVRFHGSKIEPIKRMKTEHAVTRVKGVLKTMSKVVVADKVVADKVVADKVDTKVDDKVDKSVVVDKFDVNTDDEFDVNTDKFAVDSSFGEACALDEVGAGPSVIVAEEHSSDVVQLTSDDSSGDLSSDDDWVRSTTIVVYRNKKIKSNKKARVVVHQHDSGYQFERLFDGEFICSFLSFFLIKSFYF